MRFVPHLLCLGLAALAPFACSSTPTTATTVVRPQLVAVDPDDFLGAVRCAPPLASGAELDANVARSYVATLFDVTPAADGGVSNPGIAIASSPPTSCLTQVTFSNVVAGHRYLAEVDAYDKNPEDLTPISAGSRVLSNASDGTRAVPRWAATCGGYPPSLVDAGSDAAAPGAAGSADDERPPGVVSYSTLTQTPHDCGLGLR